MIEMNDARPPLSGVNMTTLKDKDIGGGGGAAVGGKNVGSGKNTSQKRTPSVRIEIKLDAKKRNNENYEFCYPDLFKTAVKNLRMTEGKSSSVHYINLLNGTFQCSTISFLTELVKRCTGSHS